MKGRQIAHANWGRMGQTRKLRIAFFLEGMPASGVQTSTNLAAMALAAAGHAVTVFTPWSAENRTRDDESRVEFFRLPSFRLPSDQEVYWSLPVSLSVTDKFRHAHFDIIHVHTSTMVCVLAWQLSRLFKVPVVYTYHTMSKEYIHYYTRFYPRFAGTADTWIGPVVEHYDRLICNRAAAVVAPSHKAAAYLAHLAVEPPVVHIPNGIDAHVFYPGTSDYLHRGLGIPETDRILLFVGRLNHEKQPDVAYEVFRRVAERHAGAHLVLAGAGPMEADLRKRAARDRLADAVHFLGVVPYSMMPEVYRSAYLWLSTSKSEVHPMAALEAITSGLPAAVYADEALRNVVEHGVNGFAVQGIGELVKAASILLDDVQLHARMSAASAQLSRQYHVEETASRLAELYHEVRRRARLDLAA